MVINLFRLRICDRFNAAHKLVGYNGKCEKLHGHTWTVEVFVTGNKLDDIGLLVDFGVLKKELKKQIDRYDHSYLNDFKDIGNPTSENMSRFIFDNCALN